MLHEATLLSVLLHGNEKMLWREKEKSRIKVVQIDNLRGLLNIRSIDRVPNARVRVLCGVKKRVDERIEC